MPSSFASPAGSEAAGFSASDSACRLLKELSMNWRTFSCLRRSSSSSPCRKAGMTRVAPMAPSGKVGASSSAITACVGPAAFWTGRSTRVDAASGAVRGEGAAGRAGASNSSVSPVSRKGAAGRSGVGVLAPLTAGPAGAGGRGSALAPDGRSKPAAAFLRRTSSRMSSTL